MVYVLCGRLNFYYGDEIHTVDEGDCLYFDSSIPHKAVAASDGQPVKILSVLAL